jgi:hypothetical protein
MEDVLRRPPGNWRLEAQEARTLGLIQGVI